MSILDSILGGNNGGNNAEQSSNSHSFDTVIGTNPAFDNDVQDVLHSSQSDSGSSDGDSYSDSSDFTGIGSLHNSFSAPTVIGVSSSNDSSNASESHGGGNGGGLLNGLL